MCVRKVLLYESETWLVVNEVVQRLVIADSGMIRWICGVSLKDRIPTTDLLLHLGLSSINEMLRWNRQRFMDTCYVWMMIYGLKRLPYRQLRGRPRKSLCDVECVLFLTLGKGSPRNSCCSYVCLSIRLYACNQFFSEYLFYFFLKFCTATEIEKWKKWEKCIFQKKGQN